MKGSHVCVGVSWARARREEGSEEGSKVGERKKELTNESHEHAADDMPQEKK